MAKRIQLTNSCVSLASKFSFMRSNDTTMTLVVAKLPQRMDVIKKTIQGTKNARRSNKTRPVSAEKEVVLKRNPMSRHKATKEREPTKNVLRETERLIDRRKQVKGKWLLSQE